MAKRLSIFNFKQAPWGFILGLVLILGFEGMTYALDNRMYPYPYDGLRMKIKNAVSRTRGQNVDVIILGDCFNLEGTDPLQIQRATGLSTFNFATHSDYSIFTSYLFLDNYLKANTHKPKYIVINFIPELTVLSEKTFLRRCVPYLYDVHAGNFRTMTRELGFEQAVKFLFPSLKNKEFYKEGKIFKGFVPPGDIETFIESVALDQGGYKNYEQFMYEGNVVDAGQRYSYRPSPFFQKYLTKILKLAKDNNVVVIHPMFTAPPDWYTNLYMPSNMINIYFHLLASLKEEYPNLIYFSLQDQLNEKKYYRDTVHLNRAGKAVYSARLGTYLNLLQSKR